ncbi:DedA family protein [Buchnera aphidicola]|uniref:DedA family protein n=1 Tax=Buchnera aphidicola TaxID=9 RepID=UPI0034641F6B
MKDWIQYLIIKSTSHPLILVILITFLESLAIVGLLLPGIVLMTSIGTLIGNGKLSFYSAWITGMIGCLIGDYLSYYIGWKFKNWIYTIKIFQKNIHLFQNIKKKINQYSMITIIFGKLIGPTRPLIPMISGMLNLPMKKFVLPSFISCIIWPAVYFIPGIITGILMHHQKYYSKKKIFLCLVIFTICIFFFIQYMWKLYKKKKNF